MKSYEFRLVNVFAETHFSGNPLAVFPDADGLNDMQMQQIAKQFNLSEVVFAHSPTESAVKKLRIFTPDYELPFAGHPTIGAAYILRKLLDLPEKYVLQTQAGFAEIQHQQEIITFSVSIGTVERAPLTRRECAEMLSLPLSAVLSDPVWADTGTSQLLVELADWKSVQNLRIQTALFLQKAYSKTHVRHLYVWSADHAAKQIKSRLFFSINGAVLEDPGTGSAAANLGSYLTYKGNAPNQWLILQGDEIPRPNRLVLRIDEQIHVGGNVIEVGKGEFFIPSKEIL